MFAGRYTCGITQLSQTQGITGGQIIGLESRGSRILVVSRENPGGENPDQNAELFLGEGLTQDARQLTHTTRNNVFLDGAADKELEHAVIRTRFDPRNESAPEGQRLYFLELDEDELEMVEIFHAGPGTWLSSPKISSNGKRVAFISDGNPSGLNPEGNRKIFLYDAPSGTLTEVSHPAGSNLSPTSYPVSVSLTGDGKLMAVIWSHNSLSDLLVLDPESSNVVFGPMPFQPEVRPFEVFINDNGNRLFFASALNQAQQNPDGVPQIFMISAAPTLSPTTLRQLTDFYQSTDLPFEHLSFSRDGKWLSFYSRLPLYNWQGSGESNLFLLEVDSELVQQVTFGESPFDAIGPAVFGEDTVRLGFTLNADLVRLNPDSNQEAFLAECLPSKLQFFPQVGNGVLPSLNRRFETQLVFSNNGEDSAVELEFFDPYGFAQEVELKSHGKATAFHFQIQRGTPLLLQTSGEGTLEVGYVRITSGSDVNGTAVFTGSQYSPPMILYEAGVPLTEPMNDFTIVINTLSDFLTGLAFVNTHLYDWTQTSGTSTPVYLRLFDEEFNFLAQRQLDLQPGEHASFYVQNLFKGVPNVDEMVGVLWVYSERPLAAITLRQREDPSRQFPQTVPTLTTFPVTPRRTPAEESLSASGPPEGLP
jgi:hypothetical protein